MARVIGAGIIARSCYAYYDNDFNGCPFKAEVSTRNIFTGENVDGWFCRAADAPGVVCTRLRARITALLETGGGD